MSQTFFLTLPIKLSNIRKSEISDSLIGKINNVIRKVMENYIEHIIIIVILVFEFFVQLYGCLRTYCQTIVPTKFGPF